MSLLADDRARRVHYQFAHQTLRRIAQKYPADFAMFSRGLGLVQRLTNVWDAMQARFPVEERLSSEGLAVHSTADGGRTVVVVTMPPADHIGEAYFVALVIRWASLERYITLEHSWNLDDSPCTVMGEWTAETHLNLGSGPVADLQAFCESVEQRLDERPTMA